MHVSLRCLVQWPYYALHSGSHVIEYSFECLSLDILIHKRHLQIDLLNGELHGQLYILGDLQASRVPHLKILQSVLLRCYSNDVQRCDSYWPSECCQKLLLPFVFLQCHWLKENVRTWKGLRAYFLYNLPNSERLLLIWAMTRQKS